MGTPCTVGILNENGSIDGIRVNYDGYPDGVGKELISKFNSEDAVRKLIAKGDCSSIIRGIDSYADRGEELIINRCQSFEEYKNELESYNYIWKDGKWKYLDGKDIENSIDLESFLGV